MKDVEIENFLSSIGVAVDSQLVEFIIRLQKLQKTPEFCYQELKELMEEEKAREISEFIAKPKSNNLFSKAINSVVGGEQKDNDRLRRSREFGSRDNRSSLDRMRDRNNDRRSRDTNSRSGDLRSLISKSRPSSSKLSKKDVVKQITHDNQVQKPAPVVDLSKPQILCKFVREGCLNLNCVFYHPPGKEPHNVLKTMPPTTASTTAGNGPIISAENAAPSISSTNTPDITAARGPSIIVCKFDPHCTRYGCYFKHPSKTSVNKVYINPNSTSQRTFAVDQSEMMID